MQSRCEIWHAPTITQLNRIPLLLNQEVKVSTIDENMSVVLKLLSLSTTMETTKPGQSMNDRVN